jgi:threonine/homoserine/homoserine lactone efflux protein
MITFDQASAFFLFALVAAITPGPSNMMIVATGSAAGILRGVPCALGASAGMGMLLFVSTLGLGQLVTANPMLLKALNWCGATFLLWLAWKTATTEGFPEMGAAKPAGFLGAAVFQWINPKGWLVAVSAAGTYLQAATDNAWPQAAAFGSIFFLAALPSGLLWLSLGALIGGLLRDRSRRRFNIAMGLVLATSVGMMLR